MKNKLAAGYFDALKHAKKNKRWAQEATSAKEFRTFNLWMLHWEHWAELYLLAMGRKDPFLFIHTHIPSTKLMDEIK